MKAKILLSFCCLCAITSFGQDSTYQLKDFKYRTPGYKALEFSTSFNGSLADQKNVFADKSKAKNFQLYPSWIRYSKTVSTDSKLSTSTFTLNPVYGFSSSEVNSDVNKYRSGSGNFDWQFDNRFFRNTNWFWQLGNSVSIHGSFYRHSQISFMDKASLLEATDELILGFGKGRIEMVQDAQMALFILNDLREQGLVVQPDAATINSFARLITI